MPLAVISGGGAFTKANITDLNANFSALQAVDYWVRPQYGANTNAGTYDSPLATMAGASKYLKSGIVIGIEGVLFEEFTAPLGVNNVTVIGFQTTPRQATTSGVANGGGATWLSPSGGTSWLLRVRAQGWTVRNIYFNNSATAAPCVSILTDGAGDPPVDADGAHLLLENCFFTGTDDGINVNGGTNWIRVHNCTFFGFSGSGDLAVSSTVGAGVGTLLGWEFRNCKFFNNAGNITAGLSHAYIQGCMIENGTASNLNLTGGTAPNYVVGNYFNIAAADFDPAGGTTGVTGDVWSNTLTDAIETGLPAN
jgi:hypothetical protein